MMGEQRKPRVRRHTLTYRRQQKAWRAIAKIAALAEESPLDQRTHTAAISEIAERFGAEVAAACEVDTDQLVDGIGEMTADQLDRAIRTAVAEARKRVRDGRDEDGYLAGVLALINQQPTITPTPETTTP